MYEKGNKNLNLCWISSTNKMKLPTNKKASKYHNLLCKCNICVRTITVWECCHSMFNEIGMLINFKDKRQIQWNKSNIEMVTEEITKSLIIGCF